MFNENNFWSYLAIETRGCIVILFLLGGLLNYVVKIY